MERTPIQYRRARQVCHRTAAFLAPIPFSAAPSSTRLHSRRPSSPAQSMPPSPPRATLATPSGAAAEPVATWVAEPGVVHDIRTPEQFDQLIAASERADALLVADFMASWCRKCLYLLPRLRRASEAHPHVFFAKIDVNKVARLPRQFGVQKMPTFVCVRQGERVATLVGAADARVVAEQLEKLICLHSVTE